MSDIMIESIDKTRLPYFKNMNLKSLDCTIGIPYLCADKDGNMYRCWIEIPHAPAELYNEFHDSNGELNFSSLGEWMQNRFSEEISAEYSSERELFEFIVEVDDERDDQKH